MIRVLTGGRRRRVGALLTAALAAGASAVAMTSTGASAAGTITVAAVAPFSGGFATSSQGNENSWNYEIAAINKSGGINHKMVKMIVKDDAAGPNVALD